MMIVMKRGRKLARSLILLAAALGNIGVAFAGGGDGPAARADIPFAARPVANPATGGVAGVLPCEFAHDDGAAENAVGLIAGGTIVWANGFLAQPGCNFITAVRVSFGPVPDASDGHVFIYDDPDDDGNPDDAVLLAIAEVVTANEDTDTFNEYAIGPVQVSGMFFVGASVAHPSASFPANLDQSSPSQMMSWIAWNPSDPDDPLPTGNPVPTDSVAKGEVAGNYMVRAVGTSASCTEDIDATGTVDVNDLVAVLLDWGTDGSTNGGDVDFSGTVDIDDLVAVILAWGACPVDNDVCPDAHAAFGGTGTLFLGSLDCTPLTTTFSNVAAASDGAPLACDGSAVFSDVWFTYTATCDGELYIDTNGSGFDTVVELWSGCPGAGGAVLQCDDDSGDDGEDSALVRLVSAGEIIWIRIAGASGSTGGGDLNICCAEFIPEPPVNDACASATLLEPGQSDTQQTITASIDEDIQGFHCPPGLEIESPGVWYRVIGTGNTMTASLCGPGTDYDSVIHALCGSCDSLDCADGDDDGCAEPGGASSVSWCTEPGDEYFVFVQGAKGATGNFTITLTEGEACFGSTCGIIVDCFDNCVDALRIFNGLTEYLTLCATTDGPAHPQCAEGGDGGNTTEDIWFIYEADCGVAPGELGFLRVTTCEELGGSADHDTDLVIYDPSLVKGPVCDNLHDALLACNDDDPVHPCGAEPIFHSTIEVPVIQGNEYLIRLGSWNTGNAGTGELLIECTPPDSKHCAFAIELAPAPGSPATHQFDLCTAGVQAVVPTCGDAAPDLRGAWLRVIGTGTRHRIELCDGSDPQFPGSMIDTRLAVYCGPCGALECAGAPTEGPCLEQLELDTELDKEYLILVQLGSDEPCTEPGMDAIVDVVVSDLGIPSTSPPCQPCLSECEPGDILEGEPCYINGDDPDTFNNGCNGPPVVTDWGMIEVGQTICGTTSTYIDSTGAAVRDTDWYLFSPEVTGPYTLTGIAEFNIHLIVAQVGGTPPDAPQCGAVTVFEGQFGPGGCTPVSISQTLTAGGHYLMYVSLQTAAAGGAQNPCTGDDVPNVYRVTLSAGMPR